MPATIDNVIHYENARYFQPALILAAANQLIAPEVASILNANRATVLPDILPYSGGVIVSYFEWTKNIQEFHWDEGQLNAKLKKIILPVHHEVWKRTTEEGTRTGRHLSR